MRNTKKKLQKSSNKLKWNEVDNRKAAQKLFQVRKVDLRNRYCH